MLGTGLLEVGAQALGLLAVLLLGIPLASAWLGQVQQNLISRATDIADEVRVATDRRLQADRPIDEIALQQIVDSQSDLTVYIEVTYQGSTYSAGDPPGDTSTFASLGGSYGQSLYYHEQFA